MKEYKNGDVYPCMGCRSFLTLDTDGLGENKEHKHLIEYSLKLDSNPEFTTNVLVAFARAAARFAKEQNFGCKTVFDVPPAYLSPLSGDEIRAHML